MNTSIRVFIGEKEIGEWFPEYFIKDFRNQLQKHTSLFCQKRKGGLMYYAWGWRNENEVRGIFYCCAKTRIDYSSYVYLRKIYTELKNITLTSGNCRILLYSIRNYLLNIVKNQTLALSKVDKEISTQHIDIFDLQILNNALECNSIVYVNGEKFLTDINPIPNKQAINNDAISADIHRKKEVVGNILAILDSLKLYLEQEATDKRLQVSESDHQLEIPKTQKTIPNKQLVKIELKPPITKKEKTVSKQTKVMLMKENNVSNQSVIKNANCSVRVFVGNVEKGDWFPDDFKKEFHSLLIENAFVFCQKRKGDLMYYAWGWNKPNFYKGVFCCYNSLMFDCSSKPYLLYIKSKLRYKTEENESIDSLFDSCCDYLRSELGFTNIPLLAYDKQPKVHFVDSLKCGKIKELLDTNSTIFVIDKTVIVKQETKSTSKTSDEKKDTDPGDGWLSILYILIMGLIYVFLFLNFS